MASLRKEVEKLKSDVSSARNEKETIEKRYTLMSKGSYCPFIHYTFFYDTVYLYFVLTIVCQ